MCVNKKNCHHSFCFSHNILLAYYRVYFGCKIWLTHLWSISYHIGHNGMAPSDKLRSSDINWYTLAYTKKERHLATMRLIHECLLVLLGCVSFVPAVRLSDRRDSECSVCLCAYVTPLR